MKILLVFGTRPEAIKMAPVYFALKNAGVSVKTCITAQHREMLDQVLSFFKIAPDYDLNVMKPGQSLTVITSSVLLGLESVIDEFSPDWIGVHGDTTTTLAATIAGFYANVSVFHVEAGLRTGNKKSPWPEEMNRRVVGSVADLHFAPTEISKNNLISEGISANDIVVTGNTVIDALLYTLDQQGSEYNCDIRFPFMEDGKSIILVTGHRRENFGRGLEQICFGLKKIAKEFPSCRVVYPVHLNPNVQEPVKRILGGISNVFLIDPLDYPSFVFLMSQCHIILTDSGGIQEEAPSLGKPVLVMRNTTERYEAIEAGVVRLVGTSADKIYSGVAELLKMPNLYAEIAKRSNPFGDGQASNRIVRALLNERNK
ncbi:non-hydrolyzing UDP-N-acetylglucosamine 2-epimerase [Amphritea sp. HPY]|uniref:non-hydrolyzing UDP-N-acetylglucosamine 2-epimerase n=1 Tax=Amphritea sp. HPY TaxID=3421652 RepID=UPI003D7DF7A6